MPARAARTSFDAMGVEVVVGGAGLAELDSVRLLYEEWDRVFSRFRGESELSVVNRSSARILEVSPLFARACEIALQAAKATGTSPSSTTARRRPVHRGRAAGTR
jgi:thiamine biosynthesis lipoprotein ApbE